MVVHRDPHRREPGEPLGADLSRGVRLHAQQLDGRHRQDAGGAQQAQELHQGGLALLHGHEGGAPQERREHQEGEEVGIDPGGDHGASYLKKIQSRNTAPAAMARA